MDIQASIEESSIKLSILVPCAGLSIGRCRVHTKAIAHAYCARLANFGPWRARTTFKNPVCFLFKIQTCGLNLRYHCTMHNKHG